MTGQVSHRSEVWRVIGGVVAVATLGVLGVALVICVGLLLAPRPTTVSGRAWRAFLLGLSATEVVATVIGLVVGFVLGLSYPPTLWFAVLEAGLIAAVPGATVGAGVGAILALDVRRQERLA